MPHSEDAKFEAITTLEAASIKSWRMPIFPEETQKNPTLVVRQNYIPQGWLAEKSGVEQDLEYFFQCKDELDRPWIVSRSLFCKDYAEKYGFRSAAHIVAFQHALRVQYVHF